MTERTDGTDQAPTSAPTPPAGRYRRTLTPAGRRLLVAVAALVVWLVARVAHGALTEPVQWQDEHTEVNGSVSVDVAFDVTRDPSSTVTCRVRALSASHAEVGALDVSVPPSDQRDQQVNVTVMTSEAAASAAVQSCQVLR